MKLLQLFLSFCKVGLFSIGGGYAAMPLIQSEVVTLHGWITMSEFADLISVSEMTPGPIAVNSATFVGMHIAGISGALIATAGCVLPSFIIVSILARLYVKYRNGNAVQTILESVRPVIVAVIASAAVSILELVLWHGESALWQNIDFVGLAITLVSFIVLRKWKPSPILIIFGSGVVFLAVQLLTGAVTL